MNIRLKHILPLLFLCLAGLIIQLQLVTAGRAFPTRATSIPAPVEVLGFNPGDDRKLASWNQVLEYFEKLDQASDRLTFETLGRTTLDRPFVMATISAPENLAQLDEYKNIQQSLADPRKLGANPNRKAAQLIRRGKTVVLITCGIHSTEVGSYLTSMLIAHRLVSTNEPEIQSILRNTIILLVPSLNPDGVDIVKNWYDKTLGTPYEGTDPPELYHKYTGHDNNRDWYAFTQVETQITVDKIQNVWHPQIVHDIHQQGAFGSRLFVPPYMQPVEPNVPKQIVRAYTELGNSMAHEMRLQGFKGITTNSTYDAWSPSRAYSHYHGGVRILSETASCRLATPITVKFDELRAREGYDPQKESVNFGPLWRGGEWHLRDITNYMTTACFLLLKDASQNHVRWLQRFYAIASEAVRPRANNELAGFEIEATPRGLMLTDTLHRAGVESEPVSRINQSSRREEVFNYVPLAQPYGSFAKAVLEIQHYPDLRDAKGHPVAPYDVTAHTLSLLMNVAVKPSHSTRDYRRATLPESREIEGFSQPHRLAIYKSHLPVIDEGWTRWQVEQNSCDFRARAASAQPYISLTDAEARRGNLATKFDTILIPDQSPRAILNGYAAGAMPPEYTGGLGAGGVKALLEFVEQGGTLVCLNRASDFAIDQFKLPLRDVVLGLPRTDFYVPGSIVRIQLDTNHSLTSGMGKQSIAWLEESPVFEVLLEQKTGNSDSTSEGRSIPPSAVNIIARYPISENPLISGWLLGADRLKGKAALVEVKLGQGRVILFGFRPQYRGQSLATYPLFFNAIAGR